MANDNQGLRAGAYLRHNTYRIIKIIAQGGFGITYLAFDVNLEREVAIKEFFPKDYCDRDESTSHVTIGTQNAEKFVNRLKAKFLKEARNIAKFDNPGIIKIHAAFEENNTAYYVMDYIEGGSLAGLVKKDGPFPVDRALRYITQVGKALEYVHAHRINHLDIKPANIVLRQINDQPVLIDFGLSKQYDSEGNQTSTTPTGISHGYAPMEQYNEGGIKEFSPQTDLYSLAATLYFLVSGVTPPQAIRIFDDGLTFPDNFPENLKVPIIKAMSPGRRNRHETVSDFLKDIKNNATPASVPRSEDDKENPDTIIAVVEDSDDSSGTDEINPEYYQMTESSDFLKSRKSLWISIAVLDIIVGAVILWKVTATSNEVTPASQETTENRKTVTDMHWDSPLGVCTYSGDVDSLNIPDGTGTAKILEGQYKGCTYVGQFVQGNMEGEAVYTLPSGDVFTGTFHANQYDNGKYLIKSNGEYFEGTFRNGNPAVGHWYNSGGKRID